MRAGAVVMLVVAVMLGGVATFFARHWIDGRINARPNTVSPTISVVVARTPLNFGDQIKPEHLMIMKWPKGGVPIGSFTKVSQLIKGSRPRVALQRIEVNEPILKTKVSGFGGRATLSTVMNENNRAVTMRVNDVSGVGGYLLPGDRVDILMTREVKKRPITSVLLQDVRVLGAGLVSSQASKKPMIVRTLTVELSPVESQKITLAQQVGRLSMVLRPISNRSIVNLREITIKDLKGNQTDRQRIDPKAKKLPVAKMAGKKAIKKVAVKKAIKKKAVKKPQKMVNMVIYRGMRAKKGKVHREVLEGVTRPDLSGDKSSVPGAEMPPPDLAGELR
jgi:pilus assembly protein CpaB